MKKDILAIAFKGQLYKNEAASTNFVYPQRNTDWAMSIGSDPRKTLVDLNINGDFPCYTIKVTTEGVIYAYRRFLAGRSGSNCAMVMLLASRACRDGRMLIEKLHELLAYAMSQSSSDQINPIVLNEKLSSFDGMLDEKFRPIASSTQDAHKAILEKEAFRSYATDEDLIKILENPYQPTDNKMYNCIHVVPVAAMAHPTQNSNMFQINHPLEKAYFLNVPLGVEEKDNKSYVGEREPFTLVYKENGYVEETIGPLSASFDSDYFVINTGIIKVKSAKECNIRFKRIIYFSIQDEMHNPVKKWECRIDLEWRSFSKANVTWELVDGEHTISIKADGFETIEKIIDTKQQKSYKVILKSVGLTHRVYLKPVKIKGDNNNKEIKDTPVDVNFASNTSFYRSYKKVLSHDDNHVPRFYVMRKNPMLLLVMASVVAIFIGIFVGWHISKWQRTAEAFGSGNLQVEIDSLKQINDSLKNNIEGSSNISDRIKKTEEEKEREDVSYLNSVDEWEFAKLSSKKYLEFWKHVLANEEISYASIQWEDYEEITNSKWIPIRDCLKAYNSNTHNTFGKLDQKKLTSNARKTLENSTQCIKLEDMIIQSSSASEKDPNPPYDKIPE